MTAKAIENVEPRTCQALTMKAATSKAPTRLSWRRHGQRGRSASARSPPAAWRSAPPPRPDR
jgi:hypothetical protein